MANITANMVRELRERTGLGMMDCKNALSTADGDIEKAIEDLRKASGLKAEKKSKRVAAEGIVLTKIAEDGNYGVVIEVNSETDFVAKNNEFINYGTFITRINSIYFSYFCRLLCNMERYPCFAFSFDVSNKCNI